MAADFLDVRQNTKNDRMIFDRMRKVKKERTFIMKKIIAVLSAAALIISAAGCSSEKEEPKKTGTGETQKVTDVVYSAPEEEDTTQEALDYLREEVPLYVKFMEKRMSIPLTMEAKITENGELLGTSGIYIRDDHTLATIAADAQGNTTRVIYTDGKAYQIDDSAKIVYYTDYSEESAKSLVSDYLIKIKLSDVEKCSFVEDYEDLDGVTYKHEIIYQQDGTPSNFYYDENTEEIRFVRSGEQISEILKLENTVDESQFEIPEDYEQKDYAEYYSQMLQEQAAAEEKTSD